MIKATLKSNHFFDMAMILKRYKAKAQNVGFPSQYARIDFKDWINPTMTNNIIMTPATKMQQQ